MKTSDEIWIDKWFKVTDQRLTSLINSSRSAGLQSMSVTLPEVVEAAMDIIELLPSMRGRGIMTVKGIKIFFSLI